MAFLGNRRTKYKIVGHRTLKGDGVEIPGGEVLDKIRTIDEPGYDLPPNIEEYYQQTRNPTLHVFEYGGETLFIPFRENLLDASYSDVAKTWSAGTGRLAVSIDPIQPGPVVGHILERDGYWVIEGDEETHHPNANAAAREVVYRYHAGTIE